MLTIEHHVTASVGPEQHQWVVQVILTASYLSWTTLWTEIAQRQRQLGIDFSNQSLNINLCGFEKMLCL
jgi:hypothetical protein